MPKYVVFGGAMIRYADDVEDIRELLEKDSAECGIYYLEDCGKLATRLFFYGKEYVIIWLISDKADIWPTDEGISPPLDASICDSHAADVDGVVMDNVDWDVIPEDLDQAMDRCDVAAVISKRFVRQSINVI